MSVLNTEQISNPDIRLHQTKVMPIVQIYTEAMYTSWVQDNHIWPVWALDLRYSKYKEGITKEMDVMKRFHDSTRSLEYSITEKIRNLPIENLAGNIKYFLNLLFVDIIIKEQQLTTGSGYFVYNKRSGNLVMSVIVANMGL